MSRVDADLSRPRPVAADSNNWGSQFQNFEIVLRLVFGDGDIVDRRKRYADERERKKKRKLWELGTECLSFVSHRECSTEYIRCVV